jgi:hypothetical protein
MKAAPEIRKALDKIRDLEHRMDEAKSREELDLLDVDFWYLFADLKAAMAANPPRLSRPPKES